MAPLARSWAHPSHPDIQEVVINEADYTSASYSKVALPPFAIFAKFEFPPCTKASAPTYATVQTGVNAYINLNSDLVYSNHSCEPSLFFDMGAETITVGANGLRKGDELTFFYPSTEWEMDQPFTCLCKKPSCFGIINGAKQLVTVEWLSKTIESRHPVWLNDHIMTLIMTNVGLQDLTKSIPYNITSPQVAMSQSIVLHEALKYAEAAKGDHSGDEEFFEELSTAMKSIEKLLNGNHLKVNWNTISNLALAVSTFQNVNLNYMDNGRGGQTQPDFEKSPPFKAPILATKSLGISSREMSGEMGGDTEVKVDCKKDACRGKCCGKTE